jgi:hypothetical protein
MTLPCAGAGIDRQRAVCAVNWLVGTLRKGAAESTLSTTASRCAGVMTLKVRHRQIHRRPLPRVVSLSTGAAVSVLVAVLLSV